MHLLTITNRTALWSVTSNSEDRSTADKEKHLCTHTWYGKLATQMSKKGSSVLRTSPMRIWSLFCIGLHWKQIFQSHWFLIQSWNECVWKTLTCTGLFFEVQQQAWCPTHMQPPLNYSKYRHGFALGENNININPWIATYIPAINI